MQMEMTKFTELISASKPAPSKDYVEGFTNAFLLFGCPRTDVTWDYQASEYLFGIARGPVRADLRKKAESRMENGKITLAFFMAMVADLMTQYQEHWDLSAIHVLTGRTNNKADFVRFFFEIDQNMIEFGRSARVRDSDVLDHMINVGQF